VGTEGTDGTFPDMREDWNRRAREDANYYVAFGRRDQGEAESEPTAVAERGPASERIEHLFLSVEIGSSKPGRLST